VRDINIPREGIERPLKPATEVKPGKGAIIKADPNGPYNAGNPNVVGKPGPEREVRSLEARPNPNGNGTIRSAQPKENMSTAPPAQWGDRQPDPREAQPNPRNGRFEEQRINEDRPQRAADPRMNMEPGRMEQPRNLEEPRRMERQPRMEQQRNAEPRNTEPRREQPRMEQPRNAEPRRMEQPRNFNAQPQQRMEQPRNNFREAAPMQRSSPSPSRGGGNLRPR
jgi:hypothetical protein